MTVNSSVMSLSPLPWSRMVLSIESIELRGAGFGCHCLRSRGVWGLGFGVGGWGLGVRGWESGVSRKPVHRAARSHLRVVSLSLNHSLSHTLSFPPMSCCPRRAKWPP